MRPRTRDDFARLNRHLRAQGLPINRPVDAAYQLHRERVRRQATSAATTPRQRLESQLLARYTAEVRRRGGETAILVGQKASALTPEPLALVDRVPKGTTAVRPALWPETRGLVLLRAEGWRFYSRRFGSRRASLAYLAGEDDNGPFAVRVPGTCTTVQAALDFLEPAEVKTARADGRRVLRQGDVYAVETKRDSAAATVARLPDAHRWDAATRTLHHVPQDGRAHSPLEVSFPCRFVAQVAYRMGRSGRMGDAD